MPIGLDIQAFLDRLKANRGFALKWLTRGTAFKLITQDHDYVAVVANPEEGELALMSRDHQQPELRNPEVYFLQGSTGGGSVVQMGWIGINSRIRFNLFGGGVLLLSLLTNIEFIESSEETTKLLEEAEARKPRPATPEEIEELRKKFRAEWFEPCFAGPHFDEVMELLGKFCFPNGQGVMASFLETAKEYGKLVEAIAVLKRHYDNHWFFRPAYCRGEFITQIDAQYVEAAYKELGLPSPAH
jgi:hypothetical protein